MNIAANIKDNAEQFGDKVAITYLNQKFTYHQVWSSIQSFCRVLKNHQITKGDRVGLAMKDHPMHLMIHFSVAAIGAIIVPIDHRWTKKEKENAAITFKIKILILDDDILETVNSIALDRINLNQKNNSEAHIDLDFDGDLLISLSSGTTGKPKGAILNHDNLYQRFVSQWKSIGFNKEDYFALLTPLFFGAGRSFAMSMLVTGATLKIAPPPHKPEEIINILSDKNINATFLPPTLLRRLLSMADKPEPIFNNLKYLLYSGEPLHSDEAIECLEKITSNLIGYYASSEGGGISLIKPDEIEKYSHTVGTPIYQTEVEIVDDQDQNINEETLGKLRYRGPGVATNFIDENGNEYSTAEDGGWFSPGDLAKRDKKGNIQLIGRSNDLIIRGGINIYPNEIETVLMKHPNIKEVAVLGEKHVDFGESIVAFFETDFILEEDAIIHFCKEYLAPYKIPEKFIQVDSLPKKESGKIDKQLLKKKLT